MLTSFKQLQTGQTPQPLKPKLPSTNTNLVGQNFSHNADPSKTYEVTDSYQKDGREYVATSLNGKPSGEIGLDAFKRFNTQIGGSQPSGLAPKPATASPTAPQPATAPPAAPRPASSGLNPSSQAYLDHYNAVRSGQPSPLGGGQQATQPTQPVATTPTGPATGSTQPTFSDKSTIALPSYQRLNQDVAVEVNKLLEADSPYMQLARTQGMQAAAQRGLLNSSIGIQAASDAAIGKAVEIGAATASNNSALNGIALQKQFDAAISLREIRSAEERLTAQIASAEAIASAERDLEAVLQGRQIDADREQYLTEIQAQYGLQANDLAAELQRQREQITADITLQRNDINATRERLELDIGSREALAELERNLQRDLTREDISSREGIATADRLASLDNSQLNRDLDRWKTDEANTLQRDLAALNLEANDRDQFARIGAALRDTAAKEVQGLMANNEIVPEDRQAILDDIWGRYDEDYAALAATYGVEITFGGEPPLDEEVEGEDEEEDGDATPSDAFNVDPGAGSER
ncbi:MAG: hypothetical protein AAF416_14340 [Pseudomonadota bacterium]